MIGGTMVEDDRPVWARLKNEASKPYAAFLIYLKLPARVRSVERAYKISEGLDLEEPVDVSSTWYNWCTRYQWVRRALGFDDHHAEVELDKWEKRKEDARERDWQQAERLRDIVDGALPTATQFFRRNVGQPQGGSPTVVDAQGNIVREGVPAQVIVTVAFDVVGITTVLEKASKLQRLTANEPTDNINNLTGAALDAALTAAMGQYALENLPDSGQTGATSEYPREEEQGQSEAPEEEAND